MKSFQKWLKVVEVVLSILIFGVWIWCTKWDGFVPCLIGIGLFTVSGIVGFIIGCVSNAFKFWNEDEDRVPFMLFNLWSCGFMSLILDSTYDFGFGLSALIAIAISVIIVGLVAILNIVPANKEARKEECERNELECQWKKFCIGKDGAASLHQMYNRYRRELNLRYGGRNQMKYLHDYPKNVFVVDEYLAAKRMGKTLENRTFNETDFSRPNKSYGKYDTILLTNGRCVDLNIRFYLDGTFQLECDGEKVCVNSWEECIRYLDAKNEA